MSDAIARIKDMLRGYQLVNLATVTNEGVPWVRYVTAITDDDLTMRVATSLSSRKVAHILKNPQVHLSCGAQTLEHTGDYLQIQAKAEVRTDPAERHRMWGDWLKAYFSGPDDPNFAVLKLTPYRIELQSMTSMTPQVWGSGR
jgi:general stress protein 26